MGPRILLPSDRHFGLTFAVACTVATAWSAWKSNDHWQAFALTATGFLIASLAVPRLLRPLNFVWMKFGALLNAIVSPIVLGAIYFLLITPIALAMRLRGRDVLHRRFDPEVKTYWVKRDPPGPDARQSFPLQF